MAWPFMTSTMRGRSVCYGGCRNARSQGAETGAGNRVTRFAATILGETRHGTRSEEHTSELQSRLHLVCRLLLEKKKKPASPVASRCGRGRCHGAFSRPAMRPG